MKFFLKIAAANFLLFSVILSQESLSTFSVSDTVKINLQNKYKLSAVSILPFSEKVLYREKVLSNEDYRMDYRNLEFSLTDESAFMLFDTLIIEYESYLLPFKKEYKLRTLNYVYDEKISDSLRVSQPFTKPIDSDYFFGNQLEKSGSIVRGFSVSTNKDFSVNSGLRLQLSGRLSDDIEVIAALTDENTPIQPEGNTERLEELDKVFIEVKHPNAGAVFGDYDFKFKHGEFSRLDRKLQGLKGEINIGNINAVTAIAASRGKFNTNKFNGEDGNQGPYRLVGINSERDIIIIAGSEKVFIDGEETKRGDNNDFVIEYSNAEVIFTAKRLITSAIRITVDFEYTDRRFQRNFFGSNVSSKIFEDKLKLTFGFMQEGDNEESPIDITLTDDEKNILKSAGDDLNKTVSSGERFAGFDSAGIPKGIYVKVDTVINSVQKTIYKYDPGSAGALYNVTFTFVGVGKGEYKRISSSKYIFVGEASGSYLPIKYLPLPEMRRIGNFILETQPLKSLTLKLELSGSSWDKNNFSEIDDNNNLGYARNFLIRYNPAQLTFGQLNLGKGGFSLRDRFIEDRYTSLDRINTVEFERDYNITSSQTADERLTEAELYLNPFENLEINSNYGLVKKGGNFKSSRYLNNVSLSEVNHYSINYKHDYVDTENRFLSGQWLKQELKSSYTYSFLTPGVFFYLEEKNDIAQNRDSVLEGSLQFQEIAPNLLVNPADGLEIFLKYSTREESFPIEGKMKRESNAGTKSLQFNYRGMREVNSSFDLALREKKYTDAFKSLGRINNETILIRSKTKFNLMNHAIDGDVYYEASTQKTAKLEKVFIRVQQGTGNYTYLGDLNKNGIADENEFEPTLFDGDYILTSTNTDELFPVIDLKTNTRWRIDFEKLISGNSFYKNALKALSTETTWKVEENSKEKNTREIYLLNFSKFLSDTNTIRGFNLFQQDVNIFGNSPDFSVRLRFIERNNVGQFSGGLEKDYFRERAIRIKSRLVKEITNQTEYINTIDNLSAVKSLNRARLVDGEEISTDFSYRPLSYLELGFKFSVGRNEDRFPESPTIIDVNSQSLRLNISFAGKGRIRIEGERSELVVNENGNQIPFEITKGNFIGKNYFWRFNFDYRVSSNLQTTINYNGRLQGKGDAIHTLRAEARAYF
ncbi:MAG: hypothetical protein ABIJ40_18560 [Bacteroidota bacterium]